MDPIVPLLVGNRSLQILKINNNGLGPAGGAVLANALLESAIKSRTEGKTSNLRTVICGRNRLESGSAPAWAAAFAAHGTLHEVCMPQNGIWIDGITALAGGLAKNPELRHIDFQDNTFTKEGALGGVQAWADSLPSWPELHTLNLSDCVLSGKGEIPSLVSTLAEGSNPKLRSLSLQNNNLEGETFALIKEHIAGNLKGLMYLELQWNDIEEDDENLDSIGFTMKQRGGKLFVNDEDEEEDEVAQEAEEEEEKEPVAPSPATKDVADELADLMKKVEIKP